MTIRSLATTAASRLALALALFACSSTAAGPCPDGARLRGSAPPGGTLEWCERNGEKHGLWREWWRTTNQPKSVGTFRDGVMHGRWTYFHADGVSRAAGGYADGVKDGAWTEWWENGARKKDLVWTNGGRDATFTLWGEEDGTRWVIGAFSNQRPHGRFVEYHPEGHPIAEGDFVEGLRAAGWRYWDEAGMPTEVPQGSYQDD